jgi:voltage-gated potassium channel
MFHVFLVALGFRWRRLTGSEHFHTELNIIRRIAVFGVALWLLIFIHSMAMVVFEGMSMGDAIWLSITTITTVGYGDYSAATFMGRAATVVLLYIGGIFLLAQLASDYVDYRIARRERIIEGKWDWNMNGHILILNSPAYNAEIYFRRIVGQIRELSEYARTPIQILTTQFEDGLPVSLQEMGVRHYHGSPNHFDDLKHVNVAQARHILVLAQNEYDRAVDSITFDIVHRLNELGVVDRTYVECVDDDNRERLYKIGARVVLRPIRSYPEIVVRAMVAPGSEAIIEDFFTHDGDHPQRYAVDLEGVLWYQVVSALAQADFGTAMGYIDPATEHVVPNPAAATRVNSRALIVLVRESAEPSGEQIRECLQTIRSSA